MNSTNILDVPKFSRSDTILLN
eukprot:SAG31_NODE_44308_length_263_cov_0.878049_1_plen_21_part_01